MTGAGGRKVGWQGTYARLRDGLSPHGLLYNEGMQRWDAMHK